MTEKVKYKNVISFKKTEFLKLYGCGWCSRLVIFALSGSLYVIFVGRSGGVTPQDMANPLISPKTAVGVTYI